MMRYRTHCAKSGFSLIEIMVAIAIIAILGVGAWQIGSRAMARANKSKAKTTVEMLSTEIVNFNADTGQYPARLRDLVKRPEDEIGKKWEGPYVPKEEMLVDPWGNPYRYQVTTGQAHPYELFSFGPNGREAPKVEHISVWD